MTVLAKWYRGIITQLYVFEDNSPKIERFLTQGFKIATTGKPTNYTVADGWLEFNINDEVVMDRGSVK